MRRIFSATIFCALMAVSGPTVAATYSDHYCEGDLRNAIDRSINMVETVHTLDRYLDAKQPRLLAVEHANCIERIQTLLSTWDWDRNARYRDWFLHEFDWIADLLANDLAGAYELALQYRKDEEDVFSSILARFLFLWAAERGYGPAEYERIQGMFERDPDNFNIGYLRHLASKGYVPAMVDAARRWILGDGADINFGAGYYWLKRAEAEGIDMSEIVPIPHGEILSRMTKMDKRYLRGHIEHFGPID